MNTLIVNCSPVRTGATNRICKLVEENVSVENNTVKSVCIDDYKIALCKGCRSCHNTAKCVMSDDTEVLMNEFSWADKVVCVAPSYWADVPGQFKVFIDRCTPWCNTHEPYAKIPSGKKGYSIALRTGPNMKELEKVIGSIEHFYGHLEIECVGKLGLVSIEYKEDLDTRLEDIKQFSNYILNS